MEENQLVTLEDLIKGMPEYLEEEDPDPRAAQQHQRLARTLRARLERLMAKIGHPMRQYRVRGKYLFERDTVPFFQELIRETQRPHLQHLTNSRKHFGSLQEWRAESEAFRARMIPKASQVTDSTSRDELLFIVDVLSQRTLISLVTDCVGELARYLRRAFAKKSVQAEQDLLRLRDLLRNV